MKISKSRLFGVSEDRHSF